MTASAADPNEATKQLRDTLANALLRAETDSSDGTGGKILLPDPRPVNTGLEVSNGGAHSSAHESFSSTPDEDTEEMNSQMNSQNKSFSPSGKMTSTLSSKSNSTLVSLGIPEPHFTMKSRRRSRRPFTAAEDEALLKGYAVHGFQWTMIQQDKRLNLSHRKATDLRDRFRTKFPHAYRDGGSVSGNRGVDQHQAGSASIDQTFNCKQVSKSDNSESFSRELKPERANPILREPFNTVLSSLAPPAPRRVLAAASTSTEYFGASRETIKR